MSSIRSYSRRVGSLFAVAALVLATITPGLVPSFASAAELTERSIQLSSSSAGATGVTYNVKFTSVDPADEFVIDFCENSPLVRAACDLPAGFNTSAVATATSGYTVASIDANSLRVTTDILAGEAVDVVLSGIANPSDDGALYARIVTYTTTNAATYTDEDTLGTFVDSASAAVFITDKINVSGAVLESMTFCVSGPDNAGAAVTIGNNCSGTLYAPSLKLGKTSGSVVALDSSEVSEGNLYTQLSTNSAGGAIVNLKSNAAGCGGLLRAGSGAGSPTNCDITPALNTGITAGQAKFGAKVTPTTAALIGLTGYNTDTFTLNYASDQLTGVTSTYGDPFFSTDDQPVSNQNLRVTFGASVAPNTPAGLYSAELSLIATGKF